MATNHPLPDQQQPPRAAGAARSQQLAAALRQNRLTVLFGDGGAGKSALLVHGLLPLLRRRGGDAAISVAPRAPETIMPFPERRPREHAVLAELVIFVNGWDTPSQTLLHDGIDAALRTAGVDPEWHREQLTERVQSLASRFGTRFLFVLDGFEAVLEPADDAGACADLVSELVHLLNLSVPAHVLIALRSNAQALLVPLIDRLHAVRTEVLTLEGGRIRRVDDPPPTPAPPVKPKPTQLSQFDSARMPEAANTGAPTRPGDIGAVIAGGPRPVPSSAAPAVPPLPRRYAARRRAAFASVALLVMAGGAMLFQAARPTATVRMPEPVTPSLAIATTPPTPRPSQAASPPATAALARSSFELQVDAASATTRLPQELARALAADGGAELQIVPTLRAVPDSVRSPGLAIVRYDALEASTRARPKPALAIVAPLYTEELQIVVRADSPLEFIHQIEGRRINIGTPLGPRALTAQTVYRQMFGRPVPPTPKGQLGEAPALLRLVAGDGIDAVVLVAAQPAAALDGLSLVQRRSLKLLRLAPQNPASRRALQTYLPATLRSPAGAATPTLAAMSFLVTTGTPDADAAKALAQLSASLCRHLPELQRDGDAKWRELRAGLQLGTGWPQAGVAGAAWRACGGMGVARATLAATQLPAPSPRN
ncbi:MAG: TAXI family TRAP transporter solute-binding subunit [Burkholderiales bacterium]